MTQGNDHGNERKAGSVTPKAADDLRPVTVLISALGGEGGGVLTSWIVNAARARDLPVQATSIPGVAQRTGATTYYIEIWPQPFAALGAREPVLALAPAVGEVDLLVASELLELGRAIQDGFLTPDRTCLIGATGRVYTTAEKMQMGDGRYDAASLEQAAKVSSRKHVLLDMATLAEGSRAPINALLLGAIAGSASLPGFLELPIGEADLREGIQVEGKAAEDNLRGFDAALAAVVGSVPRPSQHPEGVDTPAPILVDLGATQPPSVDDPIARDLTGFPESVREIIALGVKRVVDFQDEAYGDLYLNRLAPFRTANTDLTISVARHLAVRMAFDDVFRVAQAKARPERLARIRAETGAFSEEPVIVTEFLKPGWEELCDALPEMFARPVIAWGKRRPSLQRLSWGMELRSTTVWGYLRLRLLAALRIMRRTTWRYRREQESIEPWLEWVKAGAAQHPDLGREIAECARLIKGYGETHQRGTENFASIAERWIVPALTGGLDPSTAAKAIAAAREAALSGTKI